MMPYLFLFYIWCYIHRYLTYAISNFFFFLFFFFLSIISSIYSFLHDAMLVPFLYPIFYNLSFLIHSFPFLFPLLPLLSSSSNYLSFSSKPCQFHCSIFYIFYNSSNCKKVIAIYFFSYSICLLQLKLLKKNFPCVIIFLLFFALQSYFLYCILLFVLHACLHPLPPSILLCTSVFYYFYYLLFLFSTNFLYP